ncbi:YdcF family protein [Prosthecochloris sp.]|uniref:YdcF family protein n=1 Tax=Prosthecochloris sp. TaxID=290513 RepID=UPI0025DC094D|nr:YdcF family protein [Prosthecochloris sp.]
MDSNPFVMKAFFKKILTLLVIASIIGVTAFSSLGFLVSLYEGTPEKADVIIVLGGDDGLRVKQGGELYKAGYAPNILVTGIDSRYYKPSQPNWRERRLLDIGIPERAIMVDIRSETTWEEAMNSVETMTEKGWKKAIVVSDPPHMFRLHHTWKRAVEDSQKKIILISTQPEWWHPLFWWSNKTSYRFVVSELQKNLYYAVVHF